MTATTTLEDAIQFTEDDFRLVRELSEQNGIPEIGDKVARVMWMTDAAPLEFRSIFVEALRTKDLQKIKEASYGKVDEQWAAIAQEAYETLEMFYAKIRSLNDEREQSEAKAKSAKEAYERSEKSAQRLGLYGALATVAAIGLGIYAFRGQAETQTTLDIPKYVDTKEKDGIRRTFKADAIGSSEDSSVLIRNEAFTAVNNATARAEYNDRHSNRLNSRHQYTARELHRLHQAMDKLTTESPGAITSQEAYQASLKIGETGGLAQLLEGKK